jgi:peptide/nickel transport system substrate-binding protein
MTAHPNDWGRQPQFNTIMLHFLANPAARSAALLSDAVDVIEQIPPSDVAAFQGQPESRCSPLR